MKKESDRHHDAASKPLFPYYFIKTSLLETCDAVDLTTYYIFNLYLINSQTKKQT